MIHCLISIVLSQLLARKTLRVERENDDGGVAYAERVVSGKENIERVTRQKLFLINLNLISY